MRRCVCICDFCGTESNLFQDGPGKFGTVHLVNGGKRIEDSENEFVDGKLLRDAIRQQDTEANGHGAVLDMCPACMQKHGLETSPYGEIVLDLDLVVNLYLAFVDALRLIEVFMRQNINLSPDTLPSISKAFAAFQIAGGANIMFPKADYEGMLNHIGRKD